MPSSSIACWRANLPTFGRSCIAFTKASLATQPFTPELLPPALSEPLRAPSTGSVLLCPTSFCRSRWFCCSCTAKSFSRAPPVERLPKARSIPPPKGSRGVGSSTSLSSKRNALSIAVVEGPTSPRRVSARPMRGGGGPASFCNLLHGQVFQTKAGLWK